MAWRTPQRWVADLDRRGELLRIRRPVDVHLEAGCIADRLVKTQGPAVLFEQPRLEDGSISTMPLAMNLFGTRERTQRALGAKHPTEVGDRLVAIMKPDIGGILKAPWTGLPLARDALSLPPRRVWRARSQRIRMTEPDVTRLPIPTTWPMDGGPFVTLPLVVTRHPRTREHNLGMYRAQVFGPREVGLHWQIHKHAADHAAYAREDGSIRIPVALCIGGPPELIFSAIAPLPDNLEEYMFAGFLGRRRLPLTKALTQDLLVPAEADIVIEGYAEVGVTRREGPFGDHFGFYSLEGQYPVLNVTAVTHKRDAILPATIVGQPPMEDGYLGEAVGGQFTPVLRFQHRDVIGVHLPLETGFHNLAIVASKQRYPRQGRKTALGLLGAGQMMFLKVMAAVDADQAPNDLEAFLDALNDKVDPKEDLILLPGMVADSLDPASPYENVQMKLLIDATTLPESDPRSASDVLPEGTVGRDAPEWRRGNATAPGWESSDVQAVLDLPEVEQARLLRPSILVVTTRIHGSPSPRTGMMEADEAGAEAQRQRIEGLTDAIWDLDHRRALRWLILTDDDLDLHGPGARRRLLWQILNRFDVERDLRFDDARERVAWDATTPIPSLEGPLPVRRWPAVTLHDPAILAKVEAHAAEDGLDARPWPSNLMM